VNWYAYVANNPVVGVDPEGLHQTESMWHNLRHWNCTWAPGLKQGAAILADTADVLGNPYKDSGAYDPSDPLIAAARVSAGVGVAAGGVAGAQALGIEVNVLSRGNIFKIISRRLRAGFRLDKPVHGPWGHPHFWRW